MRIDERKEVVEGGGVWCDDDDFLMRIGVFWGPRYSQNKNKIKNILIYIYYINN